MRLCKAITYGNAYVASLSLEADVLWHSDGSAEVVLGIPNKWRRITDPSEEAGEVPHEIEVPGLREAAKAVLRAALDQMESDDA